MEVIFAGFCYVKILACRHAFARHTSWMAPLQKEFSSPKVSCNDGKSEVKEKCSKGCTIKNKPEQKSTHKEACIPCLC
jgi:hypothetical protein